MIRKFSGLNVFDNFENSWVRWVNLSAIGPNPKLCCGKILIGVPYKLYGIKVKSLMNRSTESMRLKVVLGLITLLSPDIQGLE